MPSNSKRPPSNSPMDSHFQWPHRPHHVPARDILLGGFSKFHWCKSRKGRQHGVNRPNTPLDMSKLRGDIGHTLIESESRGYIKLSEYYAGYFHVYRNNYKWGRKRERNHNPLAKYHLTTAERADLFAIIGVNCDIIKRIQNAKKKIERSLNMEMKVEKALENLNLGVAIDPQEMVKLEALCGLVEAI